MRFDKKISLLSVICALCSFTLVDGHAASSVRTFGGSGTYNGTSSAIAARTGTLRSSSIRTNYTNSNSSTNNTSSDATSDTSDSSTVRTASNAYTSRLSVGKYLGAGKSVSGGSSIKSQNPAYGGTTISTGDTRTLQGQIDDLERRVDTLQDSTSDKYTVEQTDNLLNEKQDVLTAGEGIDITNGVISAVYVDGKKVLLQSDGTYIQWKYDDETSQWTDLVALADLQGPQGEQGIQGEQGPQGEPGVSADMSNYSTTPEMNAAIIAAINAASSNYATAEQGAKADTALQAADMSNYATVDDTNAALATKANTADLGALALKNVVATDDVTDTSITKPKLSTDVQASLDKADTALQSADMSSYATVDATNSALATKANTADLGTLAAKNTVETADIADANVTKPKLSADVQTSLDKADSALQPGDVPNMQGAPADGDDYVLVMNNGQESWYKIAY